MQASYLQFGFKNESSSRRPIAFANGFAAKIHQRYTRTKNMNICLYTGSALPKLGGQEAVVDVLARQFLQLGHEPTVLAPRPRLPLLPDDSRLPYRVVRHPRFFSTQHFVSWYRWFLLRAGRRWKFDVIHCHDVYPTGYVASLSAAQLGIPLVITSHGGDVREGNARLNKPGMRSRFLHAVQTADALISIGRFTTEGFSQLGADAKKIHHIPNGVDIAPFLHHPDALIDIDPAIVPGRYMLFMGRLSHRKGVDILLNALATLPIDGDVELVIAGTGDERAVLSKMIVALDLQSRVRMVGRVEGAEKIYLLQNAMCLVVPSRGWEAFPLVVLEAYAAGRPVVGSRIAGLEDVIIDGETGLLFEPESQVDLSKAMQRVRADADWTDKAGEAARQRAADYGWDRIAREHVELYRAVCGNRAQRPQKAADGIGGM
jgi:glycogen(starch) synthase